MIEEVERATGGFAVRCVHTQTEWNGSKLYVASDILDHRRKRALIVILRRPNGKEFLGRVSFDDEVTDQIIEGTGRETIPVVDPPGGVDAQMFLRALFDHAWEQGFRPAGFQDRPQEIKRLEAHLADMRALVFKDEKSDAPR